MQITTYHTAHR